MQLLTAGYDDVQAVLPDGVQLANATGVHDASTAELAVALTLASLRDFPDFFAAQQDRTLAAVGSIHGALADKRVLVLGYGSIGRARRGAPHAVRGAGDRGRQPRAARETSWCGRCTAWTSCRSCCRTTTSSSSSCR